MPAGVGGGMGKGAGACLCHSVKKEKRDGAHVDMAFFSFRVSARSPERVGALPSLLLGSRVEWACVGQRGGIGLFPEASLPCRRTLRTDGLRNVMQCSSTLESLRWAGRPRAAPEAPVRIPLGWCDTYRRTAHSPAFCEVFHVGCRSQRPSLSVLRRHTTTGG